MHETQGVLESEIIKVGVVTMDMYSIGTKFENFVQAGWRDLGSHCGCTVYCQKPLMLAKLVLFFGTFCKNCQYSLTLSVYSVWLLHNSRIKSTSIITFFMFIYMLRYRTFWKLHMICIMFCVSFQDHDRAGGGSGNEEPATTKFLASLSGDRRPR